MLSTRCIQKNCPGIKGRKGVVTNRGNYAACRQCATMYNLITKPGEIPVKRK